jgi:hypothetical protein
MGEYGEAFVAFDVAQMKHAVALAEGGRTGEVRFLGIRRPAAGLFGGGEGRGFAPRQSGGGLLAGLWPVAQLR